MVSHRTDDFRWVGREGTDLGRWSTRRPMASRHSIIHPGRSHTRRAIENTGTSFLEDVWHSQEFFRTEVEHSVELQALSSPPVSVEIRSAHSIAPLVPQLEFSLRNESASILCQGRHSRGQRASAVSIEIETEAT